MPENVSKPCIYKLVPLKIIAFFSEIYFVMFYFKPYICTP